ncbi:MAG: tetratricopeptide repeat protein [bacterium]
MLAALVHTSQERLMRNTSGLIVLLVSFGILWQTGCATVPSVSSLPEIPELTLGSTQPLTEEVGHLKHSVDIWEKMFENSQQERQRSLQQLRSLVQESSGVLREREQRLQSGLGTVADQTRQSGGGKSPAPISESPATDRFSATYRSAYSSYQRGDFQLAYDRYMQVYQQAPSKAQKGQALFWAAECIYGMRDWDKAIALFDKFRREFPADPLNPSALLRTATAYSQKGEHGNSKRVLETLVSQFPKSEEAQLARQRLKDMSGF